MLSENSLLVVTLEGAMIAGKKLFIIIIRKYLFQFC